MQLKEYIDTLYLYNMIGRDIIREPKHIGFIKSLYDGCYGPVSDEEFMQALKDKFYEPYEYNAIDVDIFKGETSFGCRGKGINNEDVREIGSLVGEMIEEDGCAYSIQRYPLKHLRVEELKNNEEWKLNMTIQNEDYYCEEFEAEVSMKRVGEKLFNLVLISWIRIN